MKRVDNSECLLDFGEWIREERECQGLSQEELGVLVGLHRTYIGKIEMAKRVVDFDTAIKLAKALKLDLSDFIKTQM
jgi:transcriptional regulator with XRE-family HTH domain